VHAGKGRKEPDDDHVLYLFLQKQQPAHRYIPIGYVPPGIKERTFDDASPSHAILGGNGGQGPAEMPGAGWDPEGPVEIQLSLRLSVSQPITNRLHYSHSDFNKTTKQKIGPPADIRIQSY
jgi:hypothetical protein